MTKVEDLIYTLQVAYLAREMGLSYVVFSKDADFCRYRPSKRDAEGSARDHFADMHPRTPRLTGARLHQEYVVRDIPSHIAETARALREVLIEVDDVSIMIARVASNAEPFLVEVRAGFITRRRKLSAAQEDELKPGKWGAEDWEEDDTVQIPEEFNPTTYYIVKLL